jgi:hypothetical protein
MNEILISLKTSKLHKFIHAKLGFFKHIHMDRSFPRKRDQSLKFLKSLKKKHLLNKLKAKGDCA